MKSRQVWLIARVVPVFIGLGAPSAWGQSVQPWTAQLQGPLFIHEQKTAHVSLQLENHSNVATTIECVMTVFDYFGNSLTGPDPRTIKIPAGETATQSLTVKASPEVSQYRLELMLKEHGTGKTQVLGHRLLADVFAGPRRELLLEDLDSWEYLLAEELTERPPDGPWERGRSRGAYNFPQEAQAMWVRARFTTPEWLKGARYELYFEEVTYACRIYLNGQPISDHAAPLYPFSVDVSETLKRGEENLLELRVQDEQVGRTPEGEPGASKLLWPLQATFYGDRGAFGVRGQQVRLRAYPEVYVRDMFLVPSVSDGRLALRFSIRNTTAETKTVKICHDVVDGEETVLGFGPQEVQLAPHETQQFEVAQPWKNPKLWWPWSPHNPLRPHLYRLRSIVFAGTERLDELSTRFGFRELRVAGRYLELNGRRFKTRLHPIFTTGMSHEEARQQFHQRLLRHNEPGETTPKLWRAHLETPSQAALEVADEVGLLLEVEGSLGSIVSNWGRPDMWQNYRGMMKDFFDKFKNHPSVVGWSLENEVLICTNTWPEWYESNQKNLLELGRFVQSLDPTRVIEFNGDADIDGTWWTMNLHYPRRWWRRSDLPNSAFWLRFGARDLPCDQSYPFRVTWVEPKPIIFGEDGIYVAACVPHDFSSLGGEEPYNLVHEGGYWAAQPVDDRGHAMLLEGHRDAEVAITCTDYGGTGGPACDRAQLPVRSFVRERDSRFFAGEGVSRSINLHHDELDEAPVTFAWKLTIQGKEIAGDEHTYPMQPAELQRLSLGLKVPQVDQPTPMVFTTTVLRNKQEVFQETHDYMAYPHTNLKAVSDLRLGLLDRAGQTAKALSEHGVKFVRFLTVEPFMVEDLNEVNGLLIGEGGLDLTRLSEFAEVVLPWVKAGGVVVCLRQEEGLDEWIPVKLKQDLRHITTIAWPRLPEHPVLNGISTDMLRYWRGDHVVSRSDFVKGPVVGWKPLLDAGGPGGLRWMPLVEMPLGQGSVLLCQMLLVDKLDTEPTAGLLLRNLLTYAAQYKPFPPVKVKAICAPHSAFWKRLASVGLEVTEDEAHIVLVDASTEFKPRPLPEDALVEETFDQLAEALAQQVADGATVVLHGLTPQNIGRWRKLIPSDVQLKPVDALYALRQAPHPLLAGLSATDLWWSEYPPWERDKQRGGVAVAYAVQGGDRGTPLEELVGPGALVEISVGKGTLFLDQLRWDCPEVNQERSGQYLALLVGNLSRLQAE